MTVTTLRHTDIREAKYRILRMRQSWICLALVMTVRRCPVDTNIKIISTQSFGQVVRQLYMVASSLAAMRYEYMRLSNRGELVQLYQHTVH